LVEGFEDGVGMGGDEGGHVECLACAESTAMDGAFATEGSAVMVVGGKSGKGGGFGFGESAEFGHGGQEGCCGGGAE